MKVLITSEELEILRKAADGLDVQMIAKSLMLRESEVTTLKKNVLKRIGAHDPIDAIVLLAQRGFDVKPASKITDADVS